MNPAPLLRSLVPAFLPLLAFVLAEALFGETVGLAAGVGLGLAEFTWILLRERRADPFVAADTGLLALAGGISLALGDDIFFKLKPAVVEFVLGAALGLLLVLPARFLEGYFGRALKGVPIGAGAVPALRRSVGLMIALLIVHAGLTAWAALALPDAGWAFVSGGLFYILVALLFLGQWLVARIAPGRPDPRGPRGSGVRGSRGHGDGARGDRSGKAETLPLVDVDGKIIGSASRASCHRDPALLHPVVRLHLLDGEGRLFLQKRADDREAEPGKWDAAMAGHVRLGESLEEALARELREELGVTAPTFETAGAKARFLFRYRHDSLREAELAFVFAASYGGPFAPSRAEVAEFRAWTREELAGAKGSGHLSPMLERDLGLLDVALAQAQAQMHARKG